jgi:hypothetical protein
MDHFSTQIGDRHEDPTVYTPCDKKTKIRRWNSSNGIPKKEHGMNNNLEKFAEALL